MKIVKAIPITEANYMAFGTDSTQPQVGWSDEWETANGIAAWNAATPYVAGNLVYVSSLHSVFQAVAPSTGIPPALGVTTPWIRLYATNAWKLFDGAVGDQAQGYAQSGPAAVQGVNTLYIALRPSQPFDTVCVLNADCFQITLSYQDPNGWNAVGLQDVAVYTNDVTDYDQYFFADLPVRKNFVFENLSGWGATAPGSGPGGLLFIAISAIAGNTVKVGEIVLGKSKSIGATLEGASLSLVDYSTKSKDLYGTSSIVPRAYSYRGSYDISIPIGFAANALGIMESLRSTPCVFYPSKEAAAQAVVQYGYISDLRVNFRTEKIANCTLQVEGLI